MKMMLEDDVDEKEKKELLDIINQKIDAKNTDSKSQAELLIEKYIDDIKKIHKHWKDKLSDINNARLTKRLKKRMATKLKKWSADKVVQAINNYEEMYRSNHYYEHNFTLYKFIKQKNGAPRFVEGLDEEYDGDLWKDYQSKFGKSSKKNEKRLKKSYDGLEDFADSYV